jgi:hypothetical protein
MNKFKNKIAYILILSIISLGLPLQSKAESAGSRNKVFEGSAVKTLPLLSGDDLTDIKTYSIDTLVFTGTATKINPTIDMVFGRTLLRTFRDVELRWSSLNGHKTLFSSIIFSFQFCFKFHRAFVP